MKYVRMPIEIESPEQMGYGNVRYNLTESSVSDQPLGNIHTDLSTTLLCYGDHVGIPALRELIGKENGLKPNEVLITAGAAAGLFIVSTSLLNTGDHLLVMHPNYATNIETPRAMGCHVGFIELKFENAFRPDFKAIKASVKPNTKIISITTPHNPTGMCLTENELMQFIQLAEEAGAYLVVDETYRDLAFSKPLPVAASFADHVISISSVSKAYGLPGLRTGWILTRNKNLQELFLAAKEQIFVCNSVLDETAALLFLQSKSKFFPVVQERNNQHFERVRQFMRASSRLEWIEPQGGVVCFPLIKDITDNELTLFYDKLNNQYHTFVGPGHWFEMDKRHFRIGYGWPSTIDLDQGLINIEKALG